MGNEKQVKEVPMQLGMFSQEEIRTARKKDRLLSLWINLSNLCNLKCRYCFNSAGEPLERELNLKEIKTMLLDLHSLGGKKVVIVGSGEPTIDPNFKQVIKFIHSLGMETVLFTNGLTIAENPKLVEYLWSRNVSITLKFHSFNPKVQNFLIGRKVSEKIYQALKIINNSPYKRSGRFSLANQVFKQNLKDIPSVYRYCRDNGIIPRVSKILFKGKGKTCKELYPTEKEILSLYQELKRIDLEEYGLAWGRFTNNVYAGDQGCQLLYCNLFIDLIGNVQSCIGILETLGNVRDKSIVEMWKKNPYKRIDKVLKGACTKCETHKRKGCYSCAGRNYLAYGDAFQSTPCHNMMVEHG